MVQQQFHYLCMSILSSDRQKASYHLCVYLHLLGILDYIVRVL